MEKIESLIGLNVRLFIDGGYELDGVIQHLDKEKVIINDNGYIFMVFKSKIYMVLLNSKQKVKSEEEDILVARYNKGEPKPSVKVEPKPNEEKFVQNGISENNQYGTILPKTLLEQQPSDPFEHIFDDETDNDFSISSSILYDDESLLDRAERHRIMGIEQEE
jgi:sRNA-binding regulator protein Hfq